MPCCGTSAPLSTRALRTDEIPICDGHFGKASSMVSHWCSPVSQNLPLDPGLRFACLGLPRLLALLHARVSREHVRVLEFWAQAQIQPLQRSRDAMPHRLGLAALAASLHHDVCVVAGTGVSEEKGGYCNRAQGPREVVCVRTRVDGDIAKRACWCPLDGHHRHGLLPAADGARHLPSSFLDDSRAPHLAHNALHRLRLRIGLRLLQQLTPGGCSARCYFEHGIIRGPELGEAATCRVPPDARQQAREHSHC
mmetsp:Transcript_8175/g.22503  ORF Transcript_8175/g.22503 Transcript_8175/m.22503 type:complete len:252 (+) Transcript_8175:381-1136(+)